MPRNIAPAENASSRGDIVVLGSGVLVEQLIGHDLVDGYHLFVHPLLLGTGKRLFRSMDNPRGLRFSTRSRRAPACSSVSHATER